jgi:hypothetical protein
MKRTLRTLFILALVVVFVRPGNGCAYPDVETIFIERFDPDGPYAAYASGKLGIVQTGYRVRHLIVAYNTLSGRGLSPAEQKAAVAVDDFYSNRAADTSAYTKQPADAGKQQWEKMFSTAPEIKVERQVPGQNYASFTNCLDDAFAHAASTLADCRALYGKPNVPDTPEIADWIAGQEAVFSNCGGAGRSPQPAPADAPLWLRQDRAYQTAAAAFYALDYDTALSGFRAIAADQASPWAPLARYLIARTLIRKAVVPFNFDANAMDKQAAINASVRSGLGEARVQLEQILRDPAMKSLHGPSAHLLDYVMVRLEPEAQAEELARRLTESKPTKDVAGGAIDTGYLQNTIDLSFDYSNQPLYSSITVPRDAHAQAATKPKAALLRWLDDLEENQGNSYPGVGYVFNQSRDAVERNADVLASWHATHEPQWLVAALTLAEPGAPANAELMAAARAIPSNSPAWASVTYHRLRLESAATTAAGKPGNSAYAEVTALMAKIEQTQPRSSINQFADLQTSLAPTLDDFLRSATRMAAGSSDEEGGENQALPPGTRPETLCGVSIAAPETRHLDDETAVIFNQRMPLKMLRQAALSPALPANVRFQLAHMAWTRGLLLDEPDTARALSPYLSGCQPAFKTWLDQYSAAATADERHVLGLLALMRFSSTEPTARIGLERDFAAYSEFRDNWWCNLNTPPEGVGSVPNPQPMLFSSHIVPRSQQPDPPFLSAADRDQVDQELARLERIPSASDYFAKEALAWVKQHPDDTRDADVLGFAMRVVRNGCRSDATGELNHQLFDLLHRRFPKSEWALRYTTWE